MPKRQVHNYINKIFLGDNFSNVNKALDYPVKFLPGKKHRLLLHDIISAPIVGFLVSKNIKGAVAALSHITVDACCTKNKKLKKFLTFLAQNKKRRK